MHLIIMHLVINYENFKKFFLLVNYDSSFLNIYFQIYFFFLSSVKVMINLIFSNFDELNFDLNFNLDLSFVFF